MSAARPRELVLASAGSGKTFLISSRIISLLARGVAPSTLLASTFTRKAAGEILSRVLGRLAEGAWDAEAAEELGRTTGVAGADRDLWRAVLARTMQAIHELDVGTLDAFFGRAVRAFAHDLGIPAGWTVADEATADRIRARALESVLDSLGRDPMVELVRGIRGGDVRRSVHEELSRDVDQVLEVHRDLSGKGPGWDALGEVLRGLGVDPSAGGSTGGDDAADEEARRGLAEELAACDLPKTKAGTPRTHWATARDRICEALRNGDWEDLVTVTLMARVRDGEGAVYDRAPLEGPVLDTLRRIAAAATRALLAEYHRRARALGRLGAAYDDALDRTLREAGVLRFEDVTRLLAGEHRLAERPELGYRMDGGTKHLLLDEFQDTSLMQWRALRPLADALMGPDAPVDGSAAVVADPKQSIYGWRGAAPVVVETLEGPGYDLVPDTLATSFRSSRVVLDAVNTVFGGIAASEVFADDDVDRETAALWARHFHPHTPDERRRGGDFAGRVTLSAGPAMEGTGSDQPEFMRYVAERIERLHRSAPERSLGVLVRRNETVARLILELRDRDVPASEEGGTRLVDSPAVVSVLALLRMTDHPGNTLARYHVAGTPVGAAVGFDDFTDHGAAARTAARVRRRLVHGGYGPFLASLREVLLPHCDDRDALRLGQLVELGYRHDDRPTLRADDFVQVVLKARVESGAGNPVRVMTVWGSKGLEFDTVVLPELFQTLVGGGRGGAPPLGYRPDGTEGVTHAFAPMKKEVRNLLETLSQELAGAYRQHRAGQVRDALSGLYVAMTRARHALHMIIPAEPDKPGGGTTPARLLRGALCNRIAPSDPTREGDRIHEDGPEDWMASAPPPKEAAAAPAGGVEGPGRGTPAPIELRDAPRRRMLPRRRPSDHEPRHGEDRTGEDPSPVEVLPEPRAGGAVVDLDRLLGLEGWDREGVPATVRGSVVHAWMEAVEWLEDGFPGEDERARLARREAPELSESALSALLDETWTWLVDRLASPAIREALTLEGTVRALADAHPGGQLVVERELPFYRREGDALVEGIIDRLVLVRESDRVVAAHVLDYKTDAILPSDEVRLRERTELYAPQLRAYRAAVAASYRIPPGAVRLTLLFLEAGKAVEVGSDAGE